VTTTRADIPPLLARRRRWRVVGASLVALVVLASVLDHAGVFGYAGNELRTMDGGRFVVSSVLDGDSLRVKSEGGKELTIHLLGVDAPDPPDAHWAAEAKTYTSNRLLNRTVTLKLDPLQPRDRHGDVLAYVYVTDGDNLNLDIIHDGQAYADRRSKHAFHQQFESAESEARKKKRGLWKDLTDDQMPAWRQQWLRDWETKRPSH
jgi:endonuclease YncB( thermonuclease family)